MSDFEGFSPQQIQNVQVGKQKKEVGDQAFKVADFKAGKKSLRYDDTPCNIFLINHF